MMRERPIELRGVLAPIIPLTPMAPRRSRLSALIIGLCQLLRLKSALETSRPDPQET